MVGSGELTDVNTAGESRVGFTGGGGVGVLQWSVCCSRGFTLILTPDGVHSLAVVGESVQGCE
jgi:hypothetical protein